MRFPGALVPLLWHVREALGDDADIGALLRVEPMLLRADISAVLERLRRLLPSMDPVKFLLSNPRVGAHPYSDPPPPPPLPGKVTHCSIWEGDLARPFLPACGRIATYRMSLGTAAVMPGILP